LLFQILLTQPLSHHFNLKSNFLWMLCHIFCDLAC